MTFSNDGLEWRSLVGFATGALAVFLGALTVVVIGQLLSGSINTRGLLHGRMLGGRRGDHQYVSPERIQLLAATLAFGGYYLLQASNRAPSGQLPQIPSSWLVALGLSNVVYLGGKAYTQLKPRSASQALTGERHAE